MIKAAIVIMDALILHPRLLLERFKETGTRDELWELVSESDLQP